MAHSDSPVDDAVPTKEAEAKDMAADHDVENGADHHVQQHQQREASALKALDLVKEHDQHHPRFWPTWKRWVIISVYCLLQVFVTLTTTSYVSAETAIQEDFGGSTQVATLGQSMFIVGNAVGPAFLGPLSDIGGRKWVYVVSIAIYALLNIATALARNLPMLIVFQFLCGAAGSTALSNVAGTIADLFADADNAAQAMGLFVASANIGASLGSPVGEWLSFYNPGSWRWIFWINVIIGGGFSALMTLIPETLPRVVIARAAKRGEAVDPDEVAIAETKVNVFQEIRFVFTMAIRIMALEPIVTFLAVYNGFAYGLLFLYLDGVFDVFVDNNGLSYIGADLTYLNFVVGVSIMFCFLPVQTWFYTRDRERNGGKGRPEARFLTSLVCVWGFPISLFWFAFTSDGNTSYWSPIIAGALLGFADPLLYLGMLNYIADAYPNVAASAIAAFLIPSFTLAAAFAHLGIIMFDNLGTTWAMACLAFISLGIVALVYLLYFFGPWLRKRSKLAKSF
ncbi:major facilitator superfamily domain-containing protein [Phyllosticta capitalensis]|uniref:Major facilitator superfamily domain-containing protein n=1 Tax=Phyllosticta capitalensis TaxID=121624 RepID=A0ABR1YZF3_9PEZI